MISNIKRIRTKRILVMMLAFVMVFMFCSTGLATSNKVESMSSVYYDLSDIRIVKLSEAAVIMQDPQNTRTYVKAIDMPNGDMIVTQYVNHEMTSEYIVKHNSHLMLVKHYDNNIVSSHYSVDSRQLTSNPNVIARAVSHTYLGKVWYNYIESNNRYKSGGVSVTLQKRAWGGEYDINGTFRDAASLVATVASLCALPARIATTVAGRIISYFGAGVGFLNLFIPEYLVDAYCEKNTMKLVNALNPVHSNSIVGTKYTITQEGSYQGNIYYSGSYYAPSNWGQYNFGSAIYHKMFDSTYWNIDRWSN